MNYKKLFLNNLNINKQKHDNKESKTLTTSYIYI